MPTTVPTDALTTRQKVKDYLGITGTTDDTLIDELITYVTQFIKSYCGGRNFLATDYVETYDSFRNRTKIFLKQRPVNTITTVEYRSGTPSSPIWVTYNSDNYLKYLQEGYIHFYSRLPEVHQGFRVTYNAGYLIDFANEFSATHTLPADLTMLATQMVAELKNKAKASGITQETTEGQSVSYGSPSVDTAQKEILGTYKYYTLSR